MGSDGAAPTDLETTSMAGRREGNNNEVSGGTLVLVQVYPLMTKGEERGREVRRRRGMRDGRASRWRGTTASGGSRRHPRRPSEA